MSDDTRLLISVNEVASRLALGRTVTSGLVSSGAIESVKIGARRLIPVGAVADFVERLRAEQLRSELSDVNG
jgi:excisionase family DNA binding protein